MNNAIKKFIDQPRILVAVIFFGVAGLIWGGWDLYGGEIEVTYPLTIFGAILLGIFGGVGLTLPDKDIKKTVRVVAFGLAGSVLGFFVAWVGIYHLSTASIYILSLLNPPADFAGYLSLTPKLGIASYWINFAVAGFTMGLFFAVGLRDKVWTMALRGTVGFGLAAIISPIVGNVIGNLFDFLLVNYLVTFLLIGMIFGLCVSYGVKASKKNSALSA